MKRKSFLSKFNQKTGWYVNWGKMRYTFIGHVPRRIIIFGNIKNKSYRVGGHLLAIAVQKSIEWEHAGVFHADAMDAKLLEHYIEKFNAWSMPISNRPFHFVVEEESAQKLREVCRSRIGAWSEEV